MWHVPQREVRQDRMMAGLIFRPENRFPFKLSCGRRFFLLLFSPSSWAKTQTREFHFKLAFSFFPPGFCVRHFDSDRLIWERLLSSLRGFLLPPHVKGGECWVLLPFNEKECRLEFCLISCYIIYLMQPLCGWQLSESILWFYPFHKSSNCLISVFCGRLCCFVCVLIQAEWDLCSELKKPTKLSMFI